MVMMIASINPATEQTVRTFDPLTDAGLEEKLARADAAYQCFRHTDAGGVEALRASWNRSRTAWAAS